MGTGGRVPQMLYKGGIAPPQYLLVEHYDIVLISWSFSTPSGSIKMHEHGIFCEIKMQNFLVSDTPELLLWERDPLPNTPPDNLGASGGRLLDPYCPHALPSAPPSCPSPPIPESLAPPIAGDRTDGHVHVR